MHPHRNQGLELVLVDHGVLNWAVDGISEELKPDTIFFTLPWQTHGSTTLREPKNRIHFLLLQLPLSIDDPLQNFSFPTSLGFSKEECQNVSQTLCSSSRHAWPASPILKAIFPELISRLDSHREADQQTVSGLLRTSLLELVRTIQVEPEPQHSKQEKIIHKLIHRIRNDLSHPWSLERFIDETGLKRTQLSQLFLHTTGQSPIAFLNRLRIEEARRLLTETHLPITQIALSCGYTTSQYFADTFKKVARLSPSQYRQYHTTLSETLSANWQFPEKRSLEEERRRIEQMREEDS
jgi:AraC-like DNA-binding protein